MNEAQEQTEATRHAKRYTETPEQVEESKRLVLMFKHCADDELQGVMEQILQKKHWSPSLVSELMLVYNAPDVFPVRGGVAGALLVKLSSYLHGWSERQEFLCDRGKGKKCCRLPKGHLLYCAYNGRDGLTFLPPQIPKGSRHTRKRNA